MGSLDFIYGNESNLLICGNETLFIFNNPGASSIENSAPAKLHLKKLIAESPLVMNLKTGNKPSSIVCAGISRRSDYIGISDSEKRLLILKKASPTENNWVLQLAVETEKRLLKILFSSNSTYCVLTDKCGDVWSIGVESPQPRGLKKILGHCSVILDTQLNEAEDKIYTCDRDEKTRESRFPQGCVIEGYFLGHREAVIGIHLLKNQEQVVTMDFTGRIIVWNTKTKSKLYVSELSKYIQLSDRQEICGVAYKQFDDTRLYIPVKVTNSSNLTVFLLDLQTFEVTPATSIELKSSCYDFSWVGSNLYVLGTGTVNELTVMCVNDSFTLVSSTVKDDDLNQQVRAFISVNQNTSIPLRKLVSNEESEVIPTKFSRVDAPVTVREESASAAS